MFGKNPKLPFQKSDGKSLDIVDIFSTFQGEGPFVGHLAIFIRLGGCNLACSFCDTEFEQYKTLSIDQIIKKVKSYIKPTHQKNYLIVITGGEPMRQNISPLCQALIQEKFIIQIETNGTFYQDLPKEVNIICSPKITNGKYSQIREDLLKKISAFKFLISKQYCQVPDLRQKEFDIPVYLQPIDEYNIEKNNQNRQMVLKLAKEHNCHISLQTHKIWGIS